MTAFNPHPMANQLNAQAFGNGRSVWTGTALTRNANSSVPIPKPYVPGNHETLEVPSGNPVPMGSEHLMAFEPRFNSVLFRLSDGTIISKSTGKIIRNGTESGRNPECWGSRKIDNPFERHQVSWNDLDKLPLQMNPFERKMTEAGLSSEDIAYAKRGEIENRKLLASMTEEQKRLLKKLENGEITKPSSLVPAD
jgi:hypothetical protein